MWRCEEMNILQVLLSVWREIFVTEPLMCINITYLYGWRNIAQGAYMYIVVNDKLIRSWSLWFFYHVTVTALRSWKANERHPNVTRIRMWRIKNPSKGHSTIFSWIIYSMNSESRVRTLNKFEQSSVSPLMVVLLNGNDNIITNTTVLQGFASHLTHALFLHYNDIRLFFGQWPKTH